MSASGSGAAKRTAILVLILIAVAAAFAYEKMLIPKQMEAAQDRLIALQDDTTQDHPKEEVQKAIGFAPSKSTENTETYRWLSPIFKRHEINVLYIEGKQKVDADGDGNANERVMTMKTFTTDKMTKEFLEPSYKKPLTAEEHDVSKENPQMAMPGGGGPPPQQNQNNSDDEDKKSDDDKSDDDKSDDAKADDDK